MNCHTVFNCVGHNHELTDNRLIKETVLKYVNEAEFKELFTIAALEKIETVTSSAIAATSSAIKASLDARNAVNDLTIQTIAFVNDAINNAAVEGGVLAATFVTVEEQITGEGALSLRDFNSRTILTVNSMAELLQVKGTTGRAVFVKGLQGGTFVYDSSKSTINDGGYIFNGWVRQLELPILTPEMFGAQGNGLVDDAPSVRACLTSAYNNKIKQVNFSKHYLLDTSRDVGGEGILMLYPNIVYQGIGDTKFIVGDNIPDNFKIMSADFFITTTSDVGNFKIDGITFISQSTATNMSTYSTNLAIHTMGLNNGVISNCTFDKLDLSNVIACGIYYEEVLYGSNIIIENNKFLSVVAENPYNIDHSSVYVDAPYSVVRNNEFRGGTLQLNKVACAVEIHAGRVLVHDNTFSGYARFCWLASFPRSIAECHIYNNTGVVSNHLLIVSASSTAGVYNCSVKNNDVICHHATGVSNFAQHQGLVITSGLLDPLGWLGVSGLTVSNNFLNITYSAKPELATIFHFDQKAVGMFDGNIIKGAVAGFNAINLNDGGGFTNNTIYNVLADVTYNKGNFLNFSGTGLNFTSISGNKFQFGYVNKPTYLIGIENVGVENLMEVSITDNSYLSPSKPLADLKFTDGVNLGSNSNTLDIGIYNGSINIPTMIADTPVSWVQAVGVNYNNMIIDYSGVSDGRFYTLVGKGKVVGSNVALRIHPLEASEAFIAYLSNVRVRTA